MKLEDLETQIAELERGIEQAKRSQLKERQMVESYCANIDEIVSDVKLLQERMSELNRRLGITQ